MSPDSPSSAATSTIRILSGFDDPSLAWSRFARSGGTDEVFQSEAWLRTWWEVFGRGRLLLVQGEQAGRLLFLPLFAEAGTGYFVGAGGSDYLDLLGDSSDVDLLTGVLATARDQIAGFLGFQLHLVPEDSPTGASLREAGARLGLSVRDEGSLPAPLLDLGPGVAAEVAGKTSLVRSERWFARTGALEVDHLHQPGDVDPHLEDFFEQHVARWQGTPHPSLFLDPVQRTFYRRLTRSLGRIGVLRFTRIAWNGAPIAFHFGFFHRGSFLWYKPSYDPVHARHSPGQVLLRSLLQLAAAEGARCFDFGIGDEPFKARFSNRCRTVRTWGLYPRSEV